MDNTLNRREFLKETAAAGLGATIAGLAASGCEGGLRGVPALKAQADKPRDLIRVGYVGIGNMGSGHVNNLLKVEGCRITAVCDIRPEKVEWARKRITDAGFPEPKTYGDRGERDFVRLCEQEDVDLVYTATPWQWHTPVCVAAMKSGKHAASEVPIATSLEECWQLVETAEKTRRHCVMMENCCYDLHEMVTLNMIHQGLLGEVLYAECGYLHDLRELKLSPTAYQGMWRLNYAIHRNGNPYPTHGIGPVAWCLDILRGDTFETLASASTRSVGLHRYAEKKYPKWAGQTFKMGDVNTSLIRTANGKTIVVKHDTHLPRPYSRDFLIQGTEGLVRKYPTPLVYIEGRSPNDQWEDMAPYTKQYEHPVWTSLNQKAQGAGHGGMDYIEDYRLIQALRQGVEPDIDVYDSVTWSAIFPVSEQSVNGRGRAVSFPEFTRGMWRQKRPLGVFEHPL
jgi:predicted dehydrogenase